MLTREIIVANAALAGLTDEQITAITTLSQNDENSVIAKKTGEIYGALDADVLNVSGVAKNGTEKTYEYVKRVLSIYKTKAESIIGLQSQIDNLSKEKTRLEKALADGANDAEAAKVLKQTKADLTSITAQYNDLNNRYQEALTNHEKELFGLRVDNALQIASANMKFKAGLPDNVTRVILQQATEKIKGMNPEMIDDGNGGKILVFKGDDGAILRNPNNQLNPFSPAELLAKELEIMGVLDKGQSQRGSGTTPPNANNGNAGGLIDVSGVKTRTEAYDAIASNLMAQGLTVGSEQFSAAMTQAWKDNNISSLPEK